MMQSKLLSAAVIASAVAAPFLLATATGAPTKAQRTELRILDCTLESRSTDDCDLVAYATRLAIFAIPGILWAILTLLMCPLYCIGKVCCNCCGGRQPSQGCCCPVKDASGNQLPMVYSRCDFLRLKFWLVISTLLIIGAFIWGYFGAAQLTGGLTDFGDAISAIPIVLTREIDNIDNSLILNSWNASTNGTSSVRLFSTTGNATKSEALAARDSLQKTIDDTLGDYNSRVDQAKEALWIAFIVPLCIMGFGFFIGCLNCRRIVPMLIVWLLFLFSMTIWVFHGVLSAGFFLFSDMCVEVDGISNQQANVIAQVAGCKDSMFSGFRTAFRDLEVSQAEQVCNQLANLCFSDSDDLVTNLANGKVYKCPNPLVCSGATFAKMIDLLETGFQIHPEIMSSNLDQARQARCRDVTTNCTVQRCSYDCAVAESEGGYLLEIGLKSAEIYIGFLGAKQVSNSIDTLGAKFANCDSAMKIVLGGLNEPCKTMVDGLENEMHASGLLAFAMLTGIFVYAWGAKRFITMDYVGLELYEGQPRTDADGNPIKYNEPTGEA